MYASLANEVCITRLVRYAALASEALRANCRQNFLAGAKKWWIWERAVLSNVSCHVERCKASGHRSVGGIAKSSKVQATKKRLSVHKKHRQIRTFAETSPYYTIVQPIIRETFAETFAEVLPNPYRKCIKMSLKRQKYPQIYVLQHFSWQNDCSS